MDPTTEQSSAALRDFLRLNKLWHRFIEFNEPVRTVEQAARKVNVDKIAKSIILIDSEDLPLMAILPAESRISYRKLKALLSVRDVRLANESEVLQFSGYPVGGVPPFNAVKRVVLDPQVLRSTTVIVGGGDVNKLLELRTADIVEIINPVVSDLTT